MEKELKAPSPPPLPGGDIQIQSNMLAAGHPMIVGGGGLARVSQGRETWASRSRLSAMEQLPKSLAAFPKVKQASAAPSPFAGTTFGFGFGSAAFKSAIPHPASKGFSFGHAAQEKAKPATSTGALFGSFSSKPQGIGFMGQQVPQETMDRLSFGQPARTAAKPEAPTGGLFGFSPKTGSSPSKSVSQTFGFMNQQAPQQAVSGFGLSQSAQQTEKGGLFDISPPPPPPPPPPPQQSAAVAPPPRFGAPIPLSKGGRGGRIGAQLQAQLSEKISAAKLGYMKELKEAVAARAEAPVDEDKLYAIEVTREVVKESDELPEPSPHSLKLLKGRKAPPAPPPEEAEEPEPVPSYLPPIRAIAPRAPPPCPPSKALKGRLSKARASTPEAAEEREQVPPRPPLIELALHRAPPSPPCAPPPCPPPPPPPSSVDSLPPPPPPPPLVLGTDHYLGGYPSRPPRHPLPFLRDAPLPPPPPGGLGISPPFSTPPPPPGLEVSANERRRTTRQELLCRIRATTGKKPRAALRAGEKL